MHSRSDHQQKPVHRKTGTTVRLLEQVAASIALKVNSSCFISCACALERVEYPELANADPFSTCQSSLGRAFGIKETVTLPQQEQEERVLMQATESTQKTNDVLRKRDDHSSLEESARYTVATMPWNITHMSKPNAAAVSRP